MEIGSKMNIKRRYEKPAALKETEPSVYTLYKETTAKFDRMTNAFNLETGKRS